MEERYYQSHLRKEVANRVKKFYVCHSIKRGVHTTRIYLPLPIPSTIQEELRMNFILGLSKTQCHVDSILIMVEIFSKMSQLLPRQKIHDVSVVRLNRILKTITSYKDVKFMSYFWKELQKRLDIILNFTNAYHPQSNEKHK